MVKISNDELNDRLYREWREGVFRGYLDRSLGPGKPQDCRLSDGRLITRLMGAEQVLWFNGDEDQRRLHVFVRTEGDALDRINEAVGTRISELTQKREGVYSGVFAGYSVNAAEVTYDGESHRGVMITAHLRGLPEGRMGGLSSSLFNYAYNLFSLPAATVAWKVPVKGKRWHVFGNTQNVRP